MKDIITVAKKELKSCFSDKVILAQILIIPFLYVFGYVMLMSTMMTDVSNDDHKYDAYVVYSPEYLSEPLEELGCEQVQPSEVDDIKDGISKKQHDLLIVFPENFTPAEQGSTELPDIEIWYNTEKNSSMLAYQNICGVINDLQPKVFSVNGNTDVQHDLGDETKSQRQYLGMVLPLMLFLAAFQVCSNLAAETIAGDKERGFLNTMLITPAKRGFIAAGKSLGIYAIAFIAGISGFVGMALSIPKLTEAMQITGVSYTVTEYLLLFVSTFTAVMVLASLLLIISTLSKSVKQATTLAPVCLIVLMISAFLSTVDSFKASIEKLGDVNYLIPAWNSMQSLKDILCLDYSGRSILIGCVVNILLSVVSVFIIGRCFESEKIVNG